MANEIVVPASIPETIEVQVAVDVSDTASAKNAEAWAVGQRGGVDVESTDLTYHNNSKHYAEQAETAKIAAQTAAASASAAYGTDLLADDYSSEKTYVVGEPSIYSGKMYWCAVPITTPEAWTAAHWSEKPVAEAVSDLKSALTSSIDFLADSEIKRIYPVWEAGAIDDKTGEDVTASGYVRSVGYIDKNAIELFKINSPITGSVYVYRYNYADGIYTYIGRNQRIGSGDHTNWLKGLAGTHFRILHGVNDVSYPNRAFTLCITTNMKADIDEAKGAAVTVKNMNIGTLTEKAREYLINILRSTIFDTDMSENITKLNRYLIEPGELIILQTGKAYRQTGGIADHEYNCITEYYPIEKGATNIILYLAIEDVSQIGVCFSLQRKEDNTLNAYYNLGNSGRQNVEYSMAIKELSEFVGFTLNTAWAQKSYAYLMPSGNILFAGSESPYAGLKNINQKGA